MNQPVMGGVPTVNAPSYVKQQKLINWVAEIAALTKPDRIHWCDGSQARIRPPVQRDGCRRHHEEAEPGKAPQQLPRLFRPFRRGARGRPHLHLLNKREEDAGPTNNWMAPDEMRATLHDLFDWLHARPHALRGAVFDGARWVRASPTSASN